MKFLLALSDAHTGLGRLLDHFRSLTLLCARLASGWALWQAGTVLLTAPGRNEGAVHQMLLPALTSLTGAYAALIFATLLFLGLFTRIGALGALSLNAALFLSVNSGLSGADPAQLLRCELWGFMLLIVAVFGPGRMAADSWLERRSAARCRPSTAALAQ